jgi:hypothetical protein
MRVVILFLTTVLVASCAGRSAPDAVTAPAIAATGEQPTDVKTVEAGSLTGNEPVCRRRPVTGSIRPQRICEGSSAGPEEVVGQEQIRDVLQDLERNHATGDLMRR